MYFNFKLPNYVSRFSTLILPFFNKLLISVRDEKEICGKEPGAVRYLFFAGIIRKKKSDSKIRK